MYIYNFTMQGLEIMHLKTIFSTDLYKETLCSPCGQAMIIFRTQDFLAAFISAHPGATGSHAS